MIHYEDPKTSAISGCGRTESSARGAKAGDRARRPPPVGGARISGLGIGGAQAPVQRTAPRDIQALIQQLAAPRTEWEAASRSATGRACRSRARRTSAAGWIPGSRSWHSLSNHAALEKIGDPAVAEVERELTPALLGSTDPADTQHVETIILVLTAIGGSTGSAAARLRVAVAARNGEGEKLAFRWSRRPAFALDQTRPRRPWSLSAQRVALRVSVRF